MWGGCVGGVSVQIPPLNLEFGREGLKWKTSCLGPCPRPRDAWGATPPGHRSMCHSPPHTDRSTVGGSASKTGSRVDADLENGGDSRKLRAPERQRPLPGWLGREALSGLSFPTQGSRAFCPKWLRPPGDEACAPRPCRDSQAPGASASVSPGRSIWNQKTCHHRFSLSNTPPNIFK